MTWQTGPCSKWRLSCLSVALGFALPQAYSFSAVTKWFLHPCIVCVWK